MSHECAAYQLIYERA
uniref:Uncharacterized protein n=1 Tax=Nymphaea colorata TaxID=210225 RepID=A0A5K1E1C4_9MAGN